MISSPSWRSCSELNPNPMNRLKILQVYKKHRKAKRKQNKRSRKKIKKMQMKRSSTALVEAVKVQSSW